MSDNKTINFDPNDLAGMIRLMDELGDSTAMFPGENENGEAVYISIFPDRIVVKTLQDNHWVRLNGYYRDGTTDETFDGRWD